MKGVRRHSAKLLRQRKTRRDSQLRYPKQGFTISPNIVVVVVVVDDDDDDDNSNDRCWNERTSWTMSCVQRSKLLKPTRLSVVPMTSPLADTMGESSKTQNTILRPRALQLASCSTISLPSPALSFSLTIE